MARLIVVLLVFSITGALIAEAQCQTPCATNQCAGCHRHSRPAEVPRCAHQPGLGHAWLVANLQTALRPLVAVTALPTVRLPQADPSHERVILSAVADRLYQPLPHAALRI